MELYIILSILFLALNWFDFYLTKRILDKGGRELNPFVRFIGLLPVKISASVVFPFIGWIFHPYSLMIPNMILLIVCIWNYKQLKKDD